MTEKAMYNKAFLKFASAMTRSFQVSHQAFSKACRVRGKAPRKDEAGNGAAAPEKKSSFGYPNNFRADVFDINVNTV